MSHKNLYDLMEKLTPERKARVIRKCEHDIAQELKAQEFYEKIQRGKVTVDIAATDLVDALEKSNMPLVEEFFRVILGRSYGDVLITDESSLYDFITVVPEPDEDTTMYHARRNQLVGKIRGDIRMCYQIPLSEEIPNKLVSIFNLLIKHRRD